MVIHHQETIDFNNVTLTLRGGGSSADQGGGGLTNYDLNDVTILANGTAYAWFGNIYARTNLPTYNFQDLFLSGDVDETAALCGFSILSAAIDTTNSSFNNVSLWNGNNLGAGARGGNFQTTTGAVYNNTVLGPFGVFLGSADNNGRYFGRFFNQGNNALTQANHTGLATNFDFRALSQITVANTPSTGTYSYLINTDSGGNIAFINWFTRSTCSIAELCFYKHLQLIIEYWRSSTCICSYQTSVRSRRT